ncbi:hypothetical protein GCM10027612_52950 [Microbispora bryophytorum subsp. camponoti]
MRRNHGCLGMSGRGLVHLLVWPTEENVGRLGHCAVHELNHNIRYSNVVWGIPPPSRAWGRHGRADGAAARRPARPRGLPVGLRIVDAHLAASGLTAAESTTVPVEAILANAGLPTAR